VPVSRRQTGPIPFFGAEIVQDIEKDFFAAAGLGMQTTGVRQSNLRAILTLISTNPGLSAAELSRRSKLAPQTVALLVDDLKQAGLLRAGEVLRGRRGQPATPYFVDPRGAYTIGVEIGWRHIEAVLVNIGGEVLGQYRRDYPFPDARTIFKELGSVTRQLTSRLAPDELKKLIGLGIAAPGGVGRNIGLLNEDVELGRLWEGIDIVVEAEKATGLPVQLYNDGNAACWAELTAYPAPRPSSFAYLLIGTFIGAGIVAESTLWQGTTGNSANLGSMLVTDEYGDQNFVHLLASIYALQQRLAGADIEIPPTTPMFWPWDEWEPHVSDWIEAAAPALAKVIANTAAVIEYRVAIIDGIMPAAVLDRLIDAVRAALASLPTLTFDTPEVQKGHLGGAAPSTGAAYLPLYRRFFSRDLSHMSD
jgi:predicted NBD/HSP70 family sugar kinase